MTEKQSCADVERPPGRSTKRGRVAVLWCDPNSPTVARGDEDHDYEGADEADRVFIASLEEAGYAVTTHPVHLGNVDRVVDSLACDVVFNLCDGSGPGRDNQPGLETLAALERRGLPYTGARAAAYQTSISKIEMKRAFQAVGVPTPAWQLFERAGDVERELRPELAGLALFVKPHDAGGSAGVDLGSIIEAGDTPALIARIERIVSEYGAALVEEYVAGREITVGLLGAGEKAKALPPLEVAFGEAFPEGKGIRTHATKWDVNSPLYNSFELLCPAPMTLTQTRQVLRVARRAYAAIDGAGYGRVDMRLDARGPFVLEVNMNCSLEYGQSAAESAMFPFAAAAAGISFPTLLHRMIEDGRRMHRAVRVERAPKAKTVRSIQEARSKGTKGKR